MAEVVRLGPVAGSAAVGHHSGHTQRAAQRWTRPAFHHVLAAAMANTQAARPGSPIQRAAFRVPAPVRTATPASVIPPQSDAALQQAMKLEGVPDSWESSLRFIMAQESGGRIGVQNPVHSARGLFQLTAANYHLNPNGARSFGNAVEEAQGGIRYIQQRYGTAENAVAFWQQHRWY